MKTLHASDRLGGVLFDIQQERGKQETIPPVEILPKIAIGLGAIGAKVPAAMIDNDVVAKRELRQMLIEYASHCVHWAEQLDEELERL